MQARDLHNMPLVEGLPTSFQGNIKPPWGCILTGERIPAMSIPLAYWERSDRETPVSLSNYAWDRPEEGPNHSK